MAMDEDTAFSHRSPSRVAILVFLRQWATNGVDVRAASGLIFLKYSISLLIPRKRVPGMRTTG